MAVFRIERTRDYTVMSNHHLRNGKPVPESQGAAFHDAVLTGGLELYHQRACRHLQGGRGRYRRRAAGAGNCRVHCPPSAARPAGSDQRYRVCHLRATTAEEPGYAPAGYGFTRYGKPGYGKTGYGKARRIKYREIKYRKNNYLWIKYRFHSLPGASGSTDCRNGKEGMRCLSQRWKIIGI